MAPLRLNEPVPVPEPNRQVMTESRQQHGIHLTIHSSKKSGTSSQRPGNDLNYQSPANQQSAGTNFFKKATVKSGDNLFRSEPQANKFVSPAPARIAGTHNSENTPETVMLPQEDFVLETGQVRNRSYKLNLESTKQPPRIANSDFQSA